MPADFATLSAGAVTLGFLHCLVGPDHYVPFIAMSRIGSWSFRKTVVVTLLCGIGHILSSVVLGFLGIALGLIVYQLGTEYSLESDSSIIAKIELLRGDVAAWLLVLFGLVYFVWGVVYAIRRRAASSSPTTAAGDGAIDPATSSATASLTPWILFTIFLFGPCEPLIPMMIAPAAEAQVGLAIWVALLFGGATVATMTVIVAAMYHGVSFVRFQKADIYGHALAGLVVLLCGLAVLFGL